MAIVFPLARAEFQDLFGFAGFSPFRLQKFEEASGLGSGQPIHAQMAPPKWIANFAFSRMRFGPASRAVALVEALGSSNRVHLYDPTIPFPRADPGGSILGSAKLAVVSLGINNRSLRIGGMPAGYTLNAGDMISVGYGSPQRRWLGRIVEGSQANGLGTSPTFEVRPPLPTGLAIGNPVTLRKAFGTFLITDFDPGRAEGLHVAGMRFSALQVTL